MLNIVLYVSGEYKAVSLLTILSQMMMNQVFSWFRHW